MPQRPSPIFLKSAAAAGHRGRFIGPRLGRIPVEYPLPQDRGALRYGPQRRNLRCRGRIGRSLLRIALKEDLFTPVSVSDIKDLDTLAALVEARRAHPGLSIDWLEKYHPIVHDHDRALFIQGLRAADLD